MLVLLGDSSLASVEAPCADSLVHLYAAPAAAEQSQRAAVFVVPAAPAAAVVESVESTLDSLP